MTRQFTLPLSLLTLALLAGCNANLPAPPPAPRPLAQPILSAADLHKAEQRAYAVGYTAGRNYQKQLDSSAPAATGAPATAAVVQAPPTAPVQPAPPPAETYSPKGPAKPVATPVD